MLLSLLWTTALLYLHLDAGCRLAARIHTPHSSSLNLLTGTILAASFLFLWLLLLAPFSSITPLTIALGALLFNLTTRLAGARWSWRLFTQRLLVTLRPHRRHLLPSLTTAFLLTCALTLLRALLFPDPEYDTNSYHLPYTTAVLDTHTLPLLDTPFGDPAAAYQPKLDAVLRAALVISPSCDTLIQIGAFPHLPLLLLSTYLTARALHCRRRAALVGTCVLILSIGALKQAAGAMVDLPFASWWMAFAALALHAHRSTTWPGLTLPAGLALGLAASTKYLAIPFAPLALLVLLLVLHKTPHSRRLRALATFAAGFLLTGSFFYLRNWYFTGNPLHPVHTTLLGHDIFTGPYGNAEMKRWKYNHNSIQRDAAFWFFAPLVGVDPPSTSITPLLVIPLTLWAGGIIASAKHAKAAIVACLAPIVVALCWFVIPYTYGRFAFLAMAFTAVAAARLAAWPLTRVLVALAIVAHMGLTLLLHQHTWSLWALTGIPLAVLVARVPRLAVLCAPPLFLVAVAFAALDARPPSFNGMGLGGAPQFLASLPDSGTVAYAGNNLPYALRGPRSRRVLYVPLDGRTDLHFHDRAREWLADKLPAPITPEPGLYRRWQDPTAWLAALMRENVAYLVVTRMREQQLLTIRHDDKGFPVEAAWAAAAAPILELVYEDVESRVFHLHIERSPDHALPAAVEQREPDAFTLLGQPEELARLYPLAAAEMSKPEYARVITR